MKRSALFFIFFLFTVASTVQALSWAYSFVVWNGNVYEIKEETVLESDIEKVIGEVETKPDGMTGNHYGNASNTYPIGTKYFEINSVSTETAIAVEVEENKWQKAVYVNEAPFHWMNVFTSIKPFFIIIPIAIVVALFIRKRKNRDQQL